MQDMRNIDKAVFVEIKMIDSILIYTNLVEVKSQEDVDNIIKDLTYNVENKVIESFGIKVLNNIKISGNIYNND